jgi:hypothetical protein
MGVIMTPEEKHQENTDKGRTAENLFSKYLDNQKIPFYRSTVSIRIKKHIRRN